FLQKLAVSVASDRPDHRQHKDIDCSQRMGFLILDHTKFVRPLSNRRSICVEIKPKWGFLPTSAFIREEHAIKRRKCRFCMYQYSKIHLGIEDDKSEYCPIDLFSGEDPLVQGALDALVKTPQNNLRVFVDGVSQQPVSAEVVDQIIAGSTKSNSLGTDQKAATTTGRQVAFTDVLTHILVRSSLLKRLGRLQQGLDSLDVQVIHQFYQQVLLDSTNASRLPEPTLEEFQNTAQAFMERMDFDAMMTEDRDIFEMQLKSSLGFGPEDELEDIPRELEMHFIREFLLSATLKDCSIMITIRKCGDEEAIATTEQQENDKDESSFCLGVFSEATHKVKIGDEMFEYKIICVDLDPKKIKSVPMYLKKDKDIVDHYLSTAGEREPSCGAY
ncbi:Inositol-pentakisphosphate 2-kinase, partial [Lunasporangiospora selenospora]